MMAGKIAWLSEGRTGTFLGRKKKTFERGGQALHFE
jgi:hypothetical protein